MGEDPPGFEDKLCPPGKLEQRLASIARPLVFTNGVFDLLHRGHVTCLARAAALGQALIVGINDDASVARLGKGTDRPVNELADRASILAALQSTTMITWFSEDTPANLIGIVKPDVLVKGGDWPVREIVGAQQVLDRGGKVFSIPFEHQRSTSAMLNRIRTNPPSD